MEFVDIEFSTIIYRVLNLTIKEAIIFFIAEVIILFITLIID